MAKKEIWEEAGYEVTVEKLLALFDKECHGHPKDIYHIYKLFFKCKVIGGEGLAGMETSDVGYFSIDALPPLSLTRNTEEQIRAMFDLYFNERNTTFD